MKMTLHIDDALLEKARAFTGASSKTATVNLALRELVRRGELVRLASEGLGLSPSELKEAFDPAYDLKASRRRTAPVHYDGTLRSSTGHP